MSARPLCKQLEQPDKKSPLKIRNAISQQNQTNRVSAVTNSNCRNGPAGTGDEIQSTKLVPLMPITKVSHSKICFSRLNQRRITVAAKKKYGESGRARAAVLLKLLFNPSDFGLVKKLLPSNEIAAGPPIRIYVFFICNIPFSRFINGKCFVGQCGRLSPRY